MQRGCELCEGVAAIYCGADKAHICWTCDAKVHSANFLVARHTRTVLCTTCATPTPWRTSGANPTPRAGLCTNCSQRESQGVCATHNNNSNNLSDNNNCYENDVARVMRASNSTACSSSSPDERSEADGETPARGDVAAPPTMSSRGAVPASVASRISPATPPASPSHRSPSKQIATTALRDVARSSPRAQCECTTRRRPETQQQPELGIPSHLRSPAKRQRRGNARGCARSCAHSSVSTGRLLSLLAKWHWDLHLSSPGTVPLALRMFRKASRALPACGLRLTLAACLRVAAGLDEAQVGVPHVREVAACACVSARRLAVTELHLLGILGWRELALSA